MGSDPKIVMLGTAPGMHSGISALVDVYATHGLFQRWNAIYLPTHREGSKARKAFVALRAWLDLAERLAAGRVALLHVHLASNASFWRKALFILPAQLFRVPYVLHVHGGHFIDFYARQPAPARRFVRYLLRHAERVIALSPQWRDALAALEPASRIEVIANPVEVPAWQAGLETPPPTVLFLGVLLERKGVHDLLRAWPAVRAAIPKARLILAGSGDRDALHDLARELDIADSVRLAGWVEHDAKDALLRGAWVLAMPSHAEALPMAVLESLAAGVPVVASRVGGIPAAVEEGRAGLLVPPRDPGALAGALLRVLGDTALRKAMGRAARERAQEEFSSEVIVPRLEALWRALAPAQEVARVSAA